MRNWSPVEHTKTAYCIEQEASSLVTKNKTRTALGISFFFLLCNVRISTISFTLSWGRLAASHRLPERSRCMYKHRTYINMYTSAHIYMCRRVDEAHLSSQIAFVCNVLHHQIWGLCAGEQCAHCALTFSPWWTGMRSR